MTCIHCDIIHHVVVSAITNHADEAIFYIQFSRIFGDKDLVKHNFKNLLMMYNVSTNLENSVKTDVHVLIMDFSKAFDKVSHNLLTLKLKNYGIQGKTNKWIHSFLSNRTQAVVL